MRRRRSSGLTLMEVLVAVALLSLLSVGILMALRVGATAWERTNENLMLDRRIASANTILHAALEGIMPAPAEFIRPPFATPTSFLFFQGEPDSMRFVTAYSLEKGPRGGVRLLELHVAPGPRGKRVLLNDLPYTDPRGAGRLVANAVDEPLTGEMRLYFVPIAALPSSFIIADELESCSFSYLLQAPEEPGRWVPQWTRMTQLPAAVSIRIAAAPESPRLQPVTVTVPIRSRLKPW